MDVNRSMSMVGIEAGQKDDPAVAGTNELGESTKAALDALHRLARHSNLAAEYALRFKEADEFYARIIEDHNRNHDLDRALGTRQTGLRTRSVRMGGDGGGVEEWHKRKDYLTNNGSIIGDDRCRDHDKIDEAQALLSDHVPPSREDSRGLELDLTAAGATPAGMQRSLRAGLANTGRLSHTPHEHGAASRRENGSNDNQQSSVLDHSHFDSPSLYNLTATDHYTRLDAELVADMEGKPFGFGYLDQSVFVGGFDEFSPGGWEAPSQEVSRLLFPLTEEDA
ncbi:hypothetical protein HYQ46_013240 [Verticillium longisporum]|nr:hypothetical protein HYQ46_013240 [Verticillium longisporum]